MPIDCTETPTKDVWWLAKTSDRCAYVRARLWYDARDLACKVLNVQRSDLREVVRSPDEAEQTLQQVVAEHPQTNTVRLDEQGHAVLATYTLTSYKWSGR